MPKNKNKSLADALQNTGGRKLSVSNTEQKIKNLITRLDIAVHQQFKILATKQNTSLQDLTCEAINDLFIKYGLSPIAKTNKDKI